MSTVEEYKAAMNELASASKEYAPVHKSLSEIAVAIGYEGRSPMEFLRANFGLQTQPISRRSSYPDAKHRLDLKKWPTADHIAAVGKRLAAAYNAVHQIYADLPQEDREYVKQPPYQVELKLDT